jgi:hypothetical protein
VKIVSRKQQRFLGAVASGRMRSKGLSARKARLMLEENRGIKLSRLPVRKAARRPASRRLGR